MNRKEIKSVAKQALKNDRWTPVAVLYVGQLLASIAPLFLNGVLSYGVNEYYLKSLNGEEKHFNDLFAGFKKYGKLFVRLNFIFYIQLSENTLVEMYSLI